MIKLAVIMDLQPITMAQQPRSQFPVLSPRMRLQINVTYGPVVKALDCGIQVPGSRPTRLFPSTIPFFSLLLLPLVDFWS